MLHMPGRGVGVLKVAIGGVLGLAAVAGLATGIGIESSKSAVYDSKISELKDELKTSKLIADGINITPPSGKGFINVK